MTAQPNIPYLQEKHGSAAFRSASVCDCGDHGFVGLTRGLVALFDAADAQMLSGKLWRTQPTKGTPYAVTGQAGRYTAMHRFVMGGVEAICDHRDGDGLNNRRPNLRVCSVAENNRNRRRCPLGAVNFKGVRAKKGRFWAEIKVNRKKVWLGAHDTPEEAARAYDAAAIRLHGEFAATNVSLGLLPPSEQPGVLSQGLPAPGRGLPVEQAKNNADRAGAGQTSEVAA